MLSVRPDLTWRDLQSLVVRSAVKINVGDSGWSDNGAGFPFNHKFGFGKLDAYAIVEMAKTWSSVGPQRAFHLAFQNLADGTIQSGAEGAVKVTKTVSESDLGGDEVPYFRLEHVTVIVNIRHDRRGDLSVYLISPSGTVAVLATERQRDVSKEGLSDWTFMTVACWGESAVGTWTLKVVDLPNPESNGVLTRWALSFYGEEGSGPFPTSAPRPTLSTGTGTGTGTGTENDEQVVGTPTTGTGGEMGDEDGSELDSRKTSVVLTGTLVGLATLVISAILFAVVRNVRSRMRGSSSSSSSSSSPSASSSGLKKLRKTRKTQNGGGGGGEEGISLFNQEEEGEDGEEDALNVEEDITDDDEDDDDENGDEESRIGGRSNHLRQQPKQQQQQQQQQHSNRHAATSTVPTTMTSGTTTSGSGSGIGRV